MRSSSRDDRCYPQFYARVGIRCVSYCCKEATFGWKGKVREG